MDATVHCSRFLSTQLVPSCTPVKNDQLARIRPVGKQIRDHGSADHFFILFDLFAQTNNGVHNGWHDAR
jgi:hypothetical protein